MCLDLANEVSFAVAALGAHQCRQSPTVGRRPRVETVEQGDDRGESLVGGPLGRGPVAHVAGVKHAVHAARCPSPGGRGVAAEPLADRPRHRQADLDDVGSVVAVVRRRLDVQGDLHRGEAPQRPRGRPV